MYQKFSMMPYKKEAVNNKEYYSMGEVATMFGVNQSQIRFYEKEFSILQPRKNKKGNRLFRSIDVENLKIIFNLVKEKGFTLQGAKDFLKRNEQSLRHRQQVINTLENLKQFLIEVKKQLHVCFFMILHSL